MNFKILDGHNDTLKNIFLNRMDFLQQNDSGCIDLKRIQNSCYIGGFFAILVPPEHPEKNNLKLSASGWEVKYAKPLDPTYAERFTDNVLKYFKTNTRKSRDIVIVRSFKDLQYCIKNNILAVIIHFEGAEAIKDDLSNLEYFYKQGLRSLGIVWSRKNAFGFGSAFKFPDTNQKDMGLTKKGIELVKKCNDLHILIDLSHITKRGFWDVAKTSCFPLVVSHTAVQSLCNSSTNLDDEQINAIGKSEGIIGILFDVLNTRPDGKYEKETSINTITNHIEYVANKIGIDYVGIGSDFDGAVMPNILKDVTLLYNLIENLEKRGFSTEDIDKITSKNWLRIIEKTWR